MLKSRQGEDMKIIIDTEKDLIMSYIVEIEKVKSKEIENTYHYETTLRTADTLSNRQLRLTGCSLGEIFKMFGLAELDRDSIFEICEYLTDLNENTNHTKANLHIVPWKEKVELRVEGLNGHEIARTTSAYDLSTLAYNHFREKASTANVQ